MEPSPPIRVQFSQSRPVEPCFLHPDPKIENFAGQQSVGERFGWTLEELMDPALKVPAILFPEFAEWRQASLPSGLALINRFCELWRSDDDRLLSFAQEFGPLLKASHPTLVPPIPLALMRWHSFRLDCLQLLVSEMLHADPAAKLKPETADQLLEKWERGAHLEPRGGGPWANHLLGAVACGERESKLNDLFAKDPDQLRHFDISEIGFFVSKDISANIKLADELLVSGFTYDIWIEPADLLSLLYARLVIPSARQPAPPRCQAPNCRQLLPELSPSGRKTKMSKKFCSDSCRQAALRVRRNLSKHF